jgi:hypothetical protein
MTTIEDYPPNKILRKTSCSMPPRPRKTVTLPLNEDGKKTLFTKLSADNYFNLMLHFLMPLDLLYTYFFRYGRVVDNDMINLGRDPAITVDNGPEIDFTQAHPEIGALVTISFISIATLSFYWETNRQKKLKNMTSAKYIFDKLQTVIAQERQDLADANQIAIEGRFDIKAYIESSFQNDTALRQKYISVGLDLVNMAEANLKAVLNPSNAEPPERPQLVMDPARRLPEPEEVIDEQAGPQHPGLFSVLKDKFLNKVLSPVYRTLILMSFVYWIEWIGTGIFTGNFFAFAVTGIPNAIAFGLPVFAGLLYPAIKIFNYFNNGLKPEHDVEPTPNEIADTEKDMSDLLRKALARREFDIQNDKLKRKLEGIHQEIRNRGHVVPNAHINGNGNGQANGNHQNRIAPALRVASPMNRVIMRLRDGQWLKPAVMFASVALGSYVVVQYCTWIISSLAFHLISEGAKTAILGAMGWPLIAIALTYGAYKAYQTYQTVLTEHHKIENLPNDNDLNDIIRFEAELADYKNRLGDAYEAAATPHYMEEQFFKDVNRHGPTEQTPFNKFLSRAFEFVNGGCTGIFLARVFFVKGSAITLPFAAFALGYPVTLAVLGAIGIGFGAFKVYEYHLQRQDAHSNHLIDSRKERLEYLKKEVEFAKLQVDVREAERLEVATRPVPVINGVGVAVESVAVRPQRSLVSSLFSCLPCMGDDAQVAPVEERVQPSLVA